MPTECEATPATPRRGRGRWARPSMEERAGAAARAPDSPGKPSRKKPKPAPPAIEAYTLQTFCAAHNISVSFYYKMKAAGIAPAEMRLLGRVLFSQEAVGRWRKEREAATRAEEKTSD